MNNPTCAVESLNPYVPSEAQPWNEQRIKHNGNVSIYYQLPEGNQVNVQIFNLLGQPVATLANAYQSAGAYTLPFVSPRKQLARG